MAIPFYGSVPSVSFDAAAGPLAETRQAQADYDPHCPLEPNLVHILSTGARPEASPSSACLFRSASSGNTIAARLLGNAYAQALGEQASGGEVDLFGREILWLRAAAASGMADDEIKLAQAYDFDRRMKLPDQALAYYIRAAEHGSSYAATAIAEASAQGRIAPDQVADFKLWVIAHARAHREFLAAARSLQANGAP